MKILIIENEYNSAEQLKWCISAVRKECSFLPFAASIQESMLIISSVTPDVIFMDLALSNNSSFDLFRETTSELPVVFTVSQDQQIARAVENKGISYLLKPAQQNMVAEAFHYIEKNRRLNFLSAKHPGGQELPELLIAPNYKSRFLVKQGQKLIPVKTTEINHFSSEGSLVYLTTWDKKKYVMDETLNELEILLNPTDFFRVNRKFIIAKEAILSLDFYAKGQVEVKARLLQSESIIVSRHQTPLLKTWLSR